MQIVIVRCKGNRFQTSAKTLTAWESYTTFASRVDRTVNLLMSGYIRGQIQCGA